MRYIIAAFLTLFATFAQAQNPQAPNTPGYTTNGSNWIADSPNTPHPTLGTLGQAVVSIGTATTGVATVTLAGVANKVTYLCGFDISAAGGTATISPFTITGLFGGTFTYQGLSAGTAPFVRNFSPCIPASVIGVSGSIILSTTADGTATAVDLQAWGYQQ